MNTTRVLGITMTTLLAASIGCASDPQVNLGNTERTGASLTDYEGSWTGYVELYTFSDGHDTVKLSLNDQGVGTLEVGDSAPLPPPDAEHGYPVGYDGAAGSSAEATPGFAYPVTGALIESKRLRVTAPLNSLYRDWCPTFPPVLRHDSSGAEFYGCFPGDGSYGRDVDGCFYGSEPGVHPIDCDRINCEFRCMCDAASCEATLPLGEIRLDGALEDAGEALVGTLQLGNDRVTVRLTRN